MIKYTLHGSMPVTFYKVVLSKDYYSGKILCNNKQDDAFPTRVSYYCRLTHLEEQDLNKKVNREFPIVMLILTKFISHL